MLSLTTEQRALLTLSLVSGLGPRLIRALIDLFGSAQEAVKAPVSRLIEAPHISEKLAAKLRQAVDGLDVDAEIRRLEQYQVRLIFLGEEEYPAALAKVEVPPQLLYIRGKLTPADARSIAIVGSRRCTSYGKQTAQRLAGDLARAGWTIVSGLARGIDREAHVGALQTGGRTVAVMAGGLASIYPPEHGDLAKQVQNSGALLTEFNMQMEPLPVLFPMRNRIISGLSQAVVVIEAGSTRSGALLTAKHAVEQGREVFAVPSSVDSTAGAGTLHLLRNSARLVRNADDILEDLQGVTPAASAAQATTREQTRGYSNDTRRTHAVIRQPPPDLDETQQKIWNFLEGQARHQDEMVQELDIGVSELSGTLLMLEMKKVIRRIPGNRFERC